MLQVTDLGAGYGAGQVLQGLSFAVRAGEIVALLGRNGSGRSTVLKSLMGLLPAHGSVRWRGQELIGRPVHQIARLGVGYVPESRDVFPDLTVQQNLIVGLPSGRRGGAAARGARAALEDAWRLFPPLSVRRDAPAGVLSGGEQQMLALARSLIAQPGLLLVDEPTEGLAPQVVAAVADALLALRRQGVAVLMAEQKLDLALQVADRCLVLGRGQGVFEGPAAGLRDAVDVQRQWLAV